MAGLSVHTKLVLGPRRARSSLVARPVHPPGQRRAGGVGSVEGRAWGGGGAPCWASPPSWQPCRRAGGLFCNTLEATASRARPYVVEKVPGPVCPAGCRRGRTPPGSPPCTVRGRGWGGAACFSAGPTDPNLPGSTAAPAATQLLGGTAMGTGILTEGASEGEVVRFLAEGGAHPSAVVSPRPTPCSARCSAERFVRCAGFSLAPVFGLSPVRQSSLLSRTAGLSEGNSAGRS